MPFVRRLLPVDLRSSWERAFGRLPAPPADAIHVVIINRRGSGKKGAAGRVMLNVQELAKALEEIGTVLVL